MNNDLISRSELKKALCEFMKNNIGIYSNEMFYLVDSIPTVEAYTPEQVKELVDLNKKLSAERPQGEWIRLSSRLYKCKNCGYIADAKYPFCHCGADMRKGGAE